MSDYVISLRGSKELALGFLGTFMKSYEFFVWVEKVLADYEFYLIEHALNYEIYEI